MSKQEFKQYHGSNIKIDLVKDGGVIQYVMVGQGISETVGSSRLPETELLEGLLSPMGMSVKDGQVVANLTA